MRRRRRSKDDNTSERLERYLARTQTPLDLFALLTLWIIIVPVRSFGPGPDVTMLGLLTRLAVSLVFAVDLTIRCFLAPRPLRYLWSHPLAILAVFLPPVRLFFSLRLLTSVFQRGQIVRFVVAATVLLLDGAIIVYFYEHEAAGANILTIGNSLWWAVATVTTVGYGDLYPVTVPGRIVATAIMGIGILTIAVVTAEVSSTFTEQVRRRREEERATAGAPEDPGQVDLRDRLERIEALLSAERSPAPEPPGPTGDAGP